MIYKGSQRNNSGDQDVQLSYLLFKLKSLLEVARQYFHSQDVNSEPIRRIEKTLGSIESLAKQFDDN
jgi:hypothetical protein